MALFQFFSGDDGPYAPKELPNDPLGRYAPHALLAKALKPKRAPRPEHEAQLLETAQQQRQEAGLFAPLVRQRLKDVADTSDETAQARGIANADTAQQIRGGSAFDRALTRGRALSRVALQGQLGVEQQALRDRIGLARFGQGLRSGTNRELGALSQLSAEDTASRFRTSQQRTALTANAAGTLAGIGIGLYRNRFQGTTFQSPDPWAALDNSGFLGGGT